MVRCVKGYISRNAYKGVHHIRSEIQTSATTHTTDLLNPMQTNLFSDRAAIRGV